jgi:hypothetical protein
MSAQFIAALKGYQYYLSTRGKASMDDINDHLVRELRNPISLRTFGHYHKLIKNGFRSYIPINKFDVFQSLGQIQMAADRRRFKRKEVGEKISISKDGTKWAAARIIDESIVGLGIRTKGKFPIRSGSQIWIRMNLYHDFSVVVVWRSHMDDGTRLGVRAFEFLARNRLSEVEIDSQRLTGLFRITRLKETELEWSHIFRVLEKTDELLEAVTDLIYSFEFLADKEISVARPIISSIHFGSSGDAEIIIDFGIAEILKIIFEKLQFWRQEKQRYVAESRRVELENDNLFIEAMRNAINLKKEGEEVGLSNDVVNAILEPIQKILDLPHLPPNLFAPDSLESGIINARILPAATELLAGDDLDFDVDVDVETKD